MGEFQLPSAKTRITLRPAGALGHTQSARNEMSLSILPVKRMPFAMRQLTVAK